MKKISKLSPENYSKKIFHILRPDKYNMYSPKTTNATLLRIINKIRNSVPLNCCYLVVFTFCKLRS